MSNSHKIAAVFATMNRGQTALACVKALAAQTRPPELVVVADNVSSDPTVSTLRELSDLPFVLRVIEMGENKGNAGGVEAAMEYAFGEGSDAVWILDDDSWPRPEALAAMLDKEWDPEVVRHAMQIDPRSKRLTWPMWVPDGRGWKLAFESSELPSDPFIPSKSSWTGALISREVYRSIGPVNSALFIRGEDEEYPWRICRAGYQFECARHSILDHPGPENLIHWRLWGMNFFIERGLADWKLYYKVRNMVWLKRRQSGVVSAVVTATAYTVAGICIDGPQRMGLLVRAIADGWMGRLGRWHGH
jgi:GT2 family glycosyltransferase